ncbi:MAG: ferric iron uptake transcriptional regulator [Gammaproteobacteria bacterium]
MTDQDIRNAGLKVTIPRMRILEIFEQYSNKHLSADEIYQLLRDSNVEIGFATVYRVLTQFEEAGLIIRHNFEGDHSVFELNQGEHHDHLVCDKCGKVVEFIDDIIERQQQAIAELHGFKMTAHSLNIYGLCPHCS